HPTSLILQHLIPLSILSFSPLPPPPPPPLFPYTTLFRSSRPRSRSARRSAPRPKCTAGTRSRPAAPGSSARSTFASSRCREGRRSEEHTSELQSPYDLVCRLLLEKKEKKK